VNGSPREVADALLARQSFVLTSHARPDGDAIGSSMALALALESLGKTVSVVLRDPVPAPYLAFPGIGRIQIVDRLVPAVDAVVFLECSAPDRPGISGIEHGFLINIDHHRGNTAYGSVNWFEPSAAACGEQVAEIIDALGVPWTEDMARYLYLASATDTGSFRYGPVSERTFEICRRIAALGVSTSELARQIFDSFTIGRVRLTGAMLAAMTLHHGNRLATLSFNDELLAACGAASDDTEGLVNLPLGAREVVAVALFKAQGVDTFRVSLRSKGAVDVRHVAALWQGGGHTNAAGFTATGTLETLRDDVVRALGHAIAAADAVPV
jgi:phosphoesterase RecJ-like protein